MDIHTLKGIDALYAHSRGPNVNLGLKKLENRLNFAVSIDFAYLGVCVVQSLIDTNNIGIKQRLAFQNSVRPAFLDKKQKNQR